jgi:hypothetical protein
VARDDDRLFGVNVVEELQRCIPVLLFHIPVFSISYIVYVFVLLVLLLCTFFLYVYTTYLSAYSRVNCILFSTALK